MFISISPFQAYKQMMSEFRSNALTRQFNKTFSEAPDSNITQDRLMRLNSHFDKLQVRNEISFILIHVPAIPAISRWAPAPFQCWFQLAIFSALRSTLSGGRGREGLLPMGSGQGIVLYNVRHGWPKHFDLDCRQPF